MAQQRYTPVPGMGPPGGVQMSQVGNRGSGYGDGEYSRVYDNVPGHVTMLVGGGNAVLDCDWHPCDPVSVDRHCLCLGEVCSILSSTSPCLSRSRPRVEMLGGLAAWSLDRVVRISADLALSLSTPIPVYISITTYRKLPVRRRIHSSCKSDTTFQTSQLVF